MAGLRALLSRSPRRVAKSGLRIFLSGGWMCTASLTVCQECWRTFVVWPSSVQQASLSTECDPTLKSLGNREIAFLGPWVTGGEWVLPGPYKIEHSLTASSELGLLRPIVWCPVSCRPTPVVVLCLFPPLSGCSWLLPAPISMSPVVARTSNGRTVEAASVVNAYPWSVSVMRSSVRGDCTPSVSWQWVRYSPLSSAPRLLLPAIFISPRYRSPAGSCWQFLL